MHLNQLNDCVAKRSTALSAGSRRKKRESRFLYSSGSMSMTLFHDREKQLALNPGIACEEKVDVCEFVGRTLLFRVQVKMIRKSKFRIRIEDPL